MVVVGDDTPTCIDTGFSDMFVGADAVSVIDTALGEARPDGLRLDTDMR